MEIEPSIKEEKDISCKKDLLWSLEARRSIGRDDDSDQTVLEEKNQQIIYYCEHQSISTSNLVVH